MGFSKFLLVSASLVAANDKAISSKFEEFKDAFNKRYSSEGEEMKRFYFFKRTVANVEKMKVLDPSAHYSYLTPLADMSEEEYAKRNSLQVTKELLQQHEAKAETIEIPSDLPDEWDWTEKGYVTQVKDQGQCGSCWSFGTVANIEGQNKMVNNELKMFSEQELVDCSKSDMGCNGGLPSRAYSDMIKNHMGLELETDYTYHAKSSTCKAQAAKEQVFLASWKQISTNEDQIAAALYKYGPLAIGVNANFFQTYKAGVMDPFFCNPMGIDHAVTIVGYGVDKDSGKKFWKIKNSWGPSWGEAGYVRLARGNYFPTCGLNRMVTTAIVKKKAAEEEIHV